MARTAGRCSSRNDALKIPKTGPAKERSLSAIISSEQRIKPLMTLPAPKRIKPLTKGYWAFLRIDYHSGRPMGCDPAQGVVPADDTPICNIREGKFPSCLGIAHRYRMLTWIIMRERLLASPRGLDKLNISDYWK